jgi:hypothetical protein
VSLTGKYAHLHSIVLILSIAGIIDTSSLPLVSAAPEISLSPSSGEVGKSVDVRGTGFGPFTAIQILFNDEPVATDPEFVRANVSGRFDAEFDVPQTAAGSAVVTARGALFADSASAQFTVLNDPPEAEDLEVSTDEDTPVQIAPNVTDANGDSLTFTVTEEPEHGTLTAFNEAGTATYTPTADYSGTDEFKFMVNDGVEDSNTATVRITVNAGNDPPTTEDQSVSVNEGGEVQITLSGSDPDGDDLTFSVTEDPESGTLSGDAPNLVYRPSEGFSGADSFAFVANDGTADSNASRVNITVSATNSSPSAQGTSVETNEDASVTVTLNANDPDSDQLTFTIASQPSHGTLGAITPVDATSATVVYSPAANYNGADSFTFRVSDETETSDAATVNIDVKPVNDIPVASSQTLTATAGQAMEITLTASDSDGNALTFDIVEGAKRGTLGQVVSTTSASAKVSYTPNSGESGSDSFTFRTTDGSEYSELATVSITIAAQSNTGGGGSSTGSSGTGSSGGSAGSTGSTSGGTGSDSGQSGGTINGVDSTNSASQNSNFERGINDEVPLADNNGGTTAQNSGEASAQDDGTASLLDDIPGQAAVQSLGSTAVEGSPLLTGPTAWLLPGVIAGVVSVVAFLGYRERRLKKGNAELQEETANPAESSGIANESALKNQPKPGKLQDRISLMVSMNKIYRILDDEKGKTAREKILDAEYNKAHVGQIEYENSKSIVKNQMEQIGFMIRSNPLLMEPFLESFGELTIKVWWAIKQEVLLDRRRGREREALEWLGSEVEKYWRSRTSSQAS